MAFNLGTLIGEKLYDAGKKEFATANLKNLDAIGLYFSAHWCGPCRGFTPKLAETYKLLKKEGKSFDIVFVSSDRSEGDWATYFGEMPWKAIPYEERKLKEKLSKKFKVEGIPSLIILDPKTGKVLNRDGREAVMEDVQGKHFPWLPPPFKEVLGTDFINNKKEVVKYDSFKDKILGLYFSAHWCGPCRGFTPNLIKTYQAIQKSHPNQFEIIFVSSDNDSAAFQEYFGTMPWLAVPFDDERREILGAKFRVEGVPTLILVKASDGTVVNKEGRSSVAEDPEGAKFPWAPEPVNELSQANRGMFAQANIAVVTFLGEAKETDAHMRKVLDDLGKAVKESKEEEEDKPTFFYIPHASKDSFAARIRQLTGIATDSPICLIIIDPQGVGYFKSPVVAKDFSIDAVNSFLTAFKADSLEPQVLIQQGQQLSSQIYHLSNVQIGITSLLKQQADTGLGLMQ